MVAHLQGFCPGLPILHFDDLSRPVTEPATVPSLREPCSLTCPLPLMAVHVAGAGPLARRYDLEPVAALLKAGEQAGRPIAFVGPYAGQFHFLGRLDRHFEETTHDSLAAWAAGHPLGLVVRAVGSPRHAGGGLISRPYGEYAVAVWSAGRLREE